MDHARRVIGKISRIMDKIAASAVVLTMLVIISNIMLRSFFNSPLTGTVDYVMILSAITITMALGLCALQNGHVAVDLIIERIPAKFREKIDLLTNVVSLLFWGITAFYMLDYAQKMSSTGTLFPTSGIPYAPVLVLAAAGIFILAAVLFDKILKIVRD